MSTGTTSNRWNVVAIGDVADVNCWSGIPYYFWRAFAKVVKVEPGRLDTAKFMWPRRCWNFGQVLRGRKPGGFQYSKTFLSRAEASFPPDFFSGEVLTFNQHFPRAGTVRARGGRVSYYIDATFESLCRDPNSEVSRLPEHVKQAAIAAEHENYAGSECVVTMARWAAEAVVREAGVPVQKVATILPGANIDLPADFQFQVDARAPGRERPIVLGFVGKDWKRKGLPFLLEVRRVLERQGHRAVVRAAGQCPPELQAEPGLEFVGFIDKHRDSPRFVEFLTGCDLGCLFSSSEPLGISTLEFLRVGVPVAGFAWQGLADTLPADAGFRFAPETTAEAVATEIGTALTDAARLDALRRAAQRWAPLVTWERCVAEFLALRSGAVVPRTQVQLWRGPAAADEA